LIAYLDSDDEWSEHFLLVMANTFVDEPDQETLYSGVRVADTAAGKERFFLRRYDRKILLERNFIFLNTFVHRRELFERLGGFRGDLRALEDWELVLRYTREKAPAVVDCCLATYFIESERPHLCGTENLENRARDPPGGDLLHEGRSRERVSVGGRRTDPAGARLVSAGWDGTS
jgi:hypothetical protein